MRNVICGSVPTPQAFKKKKKNLTCVEYMLLAWPRVKCFISSIFILVWQGTIILLIKLLQSIPEAHRRKEPAQD
jgi:hypothetical protein